MPLIKSPAGSNSRRGRAGFLRIKSGKYAWDSYFASLQRTNLEIGYHLVCARGVINHRRVGLPVLVGPNCVFPVRHSPHGFSEFRRDPPRYAGKLQPVFLGPGAVRHQAERPLAVRLHHGDSCVQVFGHCRQTRLALRQMLAAPNVERRPLKMPTG